jgi:hypothetical protein
MGTVEGLKGKAKEAAGGLPGIPSSSGKASRSKTRRGPNGIWPARRPELTRLAAKPPPTKMSSAPINAEGFAFKEGQPSPRRVAGP